MRKTVLLLLCIQSYVVATLACSCVPIIASPCTAVDLAKDRPDEQFVAIVSLGQSGYNADGRLVYSFSIVDTVAGNMPVGTDTILTGDGADCLDFFDYPLGTRALWLAPVTVGFVGHPSFCTDYASLYPITNDSIDYRNARSGVSVRLSIQEIIDRDCSRVSSLTTAPELDDRVIISTDRLTIVPAEYESNPYFELYSVAGHFIRSFAAYECGIADLPSGVYVLAARREDQLLTKKIVKAK